MTTAERRPTNVQAHYIAPLLLLALALLSGLVAPALATAQGSGAPNDPEFPQQQALDLIGATCAWQVTTGSPAVTVAVIDSGVDMGHPDLVDRLRSDGYDFVDDDNDPSDKNGHGTNVAGVVAATLDNAEGIVGLAPNVQILPVRVMNTRGKGSDGDIARGVRYAADHQARVINLSLGATLTIGAESESDLVSSAIRYAQRKGALVIVAAGNDFVPLPNAIVGDNPDVLVVAATDDRDRLAPFSNYGEWISVAAPGVHILSTMPTYEVFLTSDSVPRDERFRQGYDYMSGTSQATPFVSGLAALLFSAHPEWQAADVAQAIKTYAADISRRNPKLVAEGKLGAGRIDACRALSETSALVPTAAPTALPTIAAGGGVGIGEAPSVVASPVATPRPAPRPTRVPTQPSTPPASGSGSAWLMFGIGLLCLVVLVGVAGGTFALFQLVRRPARPPAPQVPAQPVPVAPAVQPAAAPSGPWGSLVVVGGPAQPRRYFLNGADLLIGRAPECAVALSGDQTVSRRHALLRYRAGQALLEDAGSSHGTLLNSLRLAAPTPLRRGDLIQVGQTLLRVE